MAVTNPGGTIAYHKPQSPSATLVPTHSGRFYSWTLVIVVHESPCWCSKAMKALFAFQLLCLSPSNSLRTSCSISRYYYYPWKLGDSAERDPDAEISIEPRKEGDAIRWICCDVSLCCVLVCKCVCKQPDAAWLKGKAILFLRGWYFIRDNTLNAPGYSFIVFLNLSHFS